MQTHDSHDLNCDVNYTSVVSVPTQAGYPADGTSPFRLRELSCGVTIARFVFFTTAKPAYTDPSYTAKMEVKIDCWMSTFLEADSCENVLDATSNDSFGFPRIAGCTFMGNQARLILSTRLKPQTRYDVTIKMLNPSGRVAASDNTFHLTVEYYQLMVIEGTMAEQDMTWIVPNTKDWSELTAQEYQVDWNRQRGYITSFTWKPITGDWFPDTGLQPNKFNFEITTWGVMTGTGASGNYYRLHFVAYPTNLWKFCLGGVCRGPGDACDWSPGPLLTATICNYDSFQGATSTTANGFIITVKGTPLSFLKEAFTIRADNPMVGVNLYWTATSYRYDSSGAIFEPYTVLLNSPVPVLGVPTGQIVDWELAAASQEQWLQLEFTPGNTIIGSTTGKAGIIVIIPPSTFQVVAGSEPQDPDPQYNALPCQFWPAADRQVTVTPRWVCTLSDQALLRTTVYRVRLRVKNPVALAAARSWRVELWQFFAAGGWVGGSQRAVKPIAMTRDIRGMPVAGAMVATIAPQNQLLGGTNTIRFEVVPSHDISLEPQGRLRVLAPVGFLIVRRCQGFTPVVLPPCTCIGSDANSFDLIFTEGDAITANVRYIFELALTNPSANAPEGKNIWQFDTVRPDRVQRDTATYQGFYLFPLQMTSFVVVPLTRQVGPSPMVVRFKPAQTIPFDDFVTIRAPIGVNWYQAGLGFYSDFLHTNATTVGTGIPTIDPANNNILTVQLTTAARADIEYGFKGMCIIPATTPVPNRWWVEQKRQTGLPPPNNWRYIASAGAEGFKSLVLVNTLVVPFNLVEEAWENPTLITFQATQSVQSTTKLAGSGIVNVSAELLVVAPPGFTWICPLSTTIYMPDFAVPIPSDAQCAVDHNNQAKRNQLSVSFPGGIQADVRYALTINMVNGAIASLDLSKNYFRLATRLNAVEIEAAIVPGFLMASRMDNTRLMNLPSQQNFFPEYTSNVVTFYIGTTAAITVDTILEIKAPREFAFPSICTDSVGYPGGPNGIQGLLQLPTIIACQNLQHVDISMSYIAQMTMTGTWLLGTTAIFCTVTNPMFTSPVNFWGFTILTRALVPLQSEARVYGFQIAVVLSAVLNPYNRGNGVAKEAAIDIVELSFILTTYIPGSMARRNQIILTAPEGFTFPSICRSFAPGTGNSGTVSLPQETACQGSGTVLTLTLPAMRELQNQTRYEFRFLVINPDEPFVDVTAQRRWWKITTRQDPLRPVDQTRNIPSFPVYNRVSFIQCDTLSQVGLNTTTFRFLLRTSAPLAPKQTVTITPPPGTIFSGLAGGACFNVDPMIIKQTFDEDYNMKALIAGVTALPDWMSCKVFKPPVNQVVLTNSEPLLGGRPLINGPVFEFFVQNATNAEATPAPGLNLFRVAAKTMITYGVEEFAGDGWTIYPELLSTAVTSSNPGFSLYTNFTFTLQTVTAVPTGGSIRIVAPDDYYFGPLIETPATAYDPLVSVPAPQGAMNDERPTGSISCGVLRPSGWACPFQLIPCDTQRMYTALQGYGVVLTATQLAAKSVATIQCNTMTQKCSGGKLSDLVTCVSTGNVLVISLQDGVALPARRLFGFLVQGYNTRASHAPLAYTTRGLQPCVTCAANMWYYETRDSDSEKTVLDKKGGILGFELLGIVTVRSIVPSEQRVGSIENFVTVTLSLDVACDPRATLQITHPIEYLKNANAAFQGAAISTGPTFPRMQEIRQSLNVIQIIAIEERIPANTDMTITIIMSNPSVSPSRMNNIWTFEASSARTGQKVINDVNYNVSGFKIFGEFSRAQITSTVLSPGSSSIIGVWFVLKSKLVRNVEGFDKAMRIWVPQGFMPTPPPRPPLYVRTSCRDFSPTYNKYRTGVTNGFPQTINYFDLPTSYCYNQWSEDYQQFYVQITIDGTEELIDGLDYAFEFGVTNPGVFAMPPPSLNVWRVDTALERVILHLKTGIPGYELEQIKIVRVSEADTTKNKRLNPVVLFFQTAKFLPGGSVVRLTAPVTFQINCIFFRVTLNLSPTTTCLVKRPYIVEFTIDSQDPKQADTPMELNVMVANPQFTPQNNWWRVDMISPLGQAIDARDYIPGFDITDKVEVTIGATFPYIGQHNPLLVVFLTHTIMNQADTGNELVLTGPTGWVFPTICTGFHLRLTDNMQVATNTGGYATGFVFPPLGTTCTGFGNSTVTIRLPNGSGLLINNYTLQIDVQNPGYRPNVSNLWSLLTQVRNENGTMIVDANKTIQGFSMDELLSLRLLENAASRLRPLTLALVGAVAAVAAGLPRRWCGS